MSSHVEKIKEKLPINEVVGSYIQLQKVGINYKGKCPFHNEKTPSFFVSPGRDNYYCFGCNEGGDIFSFVEKIEGVDFMGALKILSEKSGVPISLEKSGDKSKRQKLFEIMEIATIFYQNKLNENSSVNQYIKGRGLDEKTSSMWRIGYAPNEWQTLTTYLRGKGIADSDIIGAGLAKRGNSEDKFYDTFRDRVVFPIFDTSGRTVAFSGRLFSPSDTSAKYLNSPETELFSKGEVLYGLNFAKNEIRKKDYSVLVEGQFDLVMSHMAGVQNTVATSGTAFTESHLERLFKLSPRIIMAFDSDTAGLNATLKASKLALKIGMQVKVAIIPDGKDPADMAKDDVLVWKECLRNAVHVIEFYLNKLVEGTADKRMLARSVSEKILPFVILINSKIEREYFVNLISEKLKSKKESIYEDIEQIEKKGVARSDQTTNKVLENKTPIGNIERRVMSIFYWYNSNILKAPDSAVLKEKIINTIGLQAFDELDRLLTPSNNELIFEAENYYNESNSITNETDDLIRSLGLKILKEDFARTVYSLDEAERDGNKDKIPDLLHKCQEITAKIQKLKDA